MVKYFVGLLLILFLAGCNDFSNVEQKTDSSTFAKSTNYKIHFIELGSVSCVPCKMMQPVMESIKKRFGGQIQITFYDVWTNEEKQYAEKYKIDGIPTQVFLNPKGEEVLRHVGFFPEDEIASFLKSQGLIEIK